MVSLNKACLLKPAFLKVDTLRGQSFSSKGKKPRDRVENDSFPFPKMDASMQFRQKYFKKHSAQPPLGYSFLDLSINGKHTGSACGFQ